jgi:hypothetical protein
VQKILGILPRLKELAGRQWMLRRTVFHSADRGNWGGRGVQWNILRRSELTWNSKFSSGYAMVSERQVSEMGKEVPAIAVKEIEAQ